MPLAPAAASLPLRVATRPAAASPPRRRHGFMLTELVLAVAILGLSLALAGTLLSRYWRRQHCERLAHELRTFAAAFQDYERRHSTWPTASDGSKNAPRGMESVLQGTSWSERTPVGGRYQWLVPYPLAATDASRPPGGAIAVTAFRPDLALDLANEDLLYLDAQLDDGNLATGNFRAGFNGWPVFLIASRR